RVSPSRWTVSLLPLARGVPPRAFFVGTGPPTTTEGADGPTQGARAGGTNMLIGWLIAGAALLAFLGLMLLVGYLGTRSPSVEQARRTVQQQREHLEAKFYHLAASSAPPRGL